MNQCPCCGQLIPEPSIPAGLKLTKMQERIFVLVKTAGTNGISCDALISKLYADHIDGGPTWARQSLRTQIHRLNTKLLDHKMVIRAPFGGQHNPTEYTLRELAK